MLKDILNESFRFDRGTMNNQFIDVNSHDFRVVFGDLNFRLKPEAVNIERVMKAVETQIYEDTLRHDDFYFFRKNDNVL